MNKERDYLIPETVFLIKINLTAPYIELFKINSNV
jgi:hypothetical protein